VFFGRTQNLELWFEALTERDLQYVATGTVVDRQITFHLDALQALQEERCYCAL